jgi:hypothetical protein
VDLYSLHNTIISLRFHIDSPTIILVTENLASLRLHETTLSNILHPIVGRSNTKSSYTRYVTNSLSAGVARVSVLHAKWARSSPDGALSAQCQELNALHSQCVDGANIKIPDKLATPPEQKEPFILDLLEQASVEFSTRFGESASRRTEILTVDQLEGERLLGQLLKSNQSALSEYELFNLAYRLATKYSIDIRPYLAQIDMSALTTAEKHTITTTLSLSAVDYPYIWNSLVRSDILTPRDLYQRNLGHPFALHRLYSSRNNGFTTFFEFLRMATQDYTRKVLILQVCLELNNVRPE